MAKRMLIDATHPEETRVVVVSGKKLEEFDFETTSKKQLKGNIYLAKVTRVEPSLQAAFVDYGGNRHGFLAFSEIHPDYYQIPVADREALMAEEHAHAEEQAAEEEEGSKPKRRSRGGRSRSRAESTSTDDAVTSAEVAGMETIDLDDEEGSSPMERVAETPVEEPEGNGTDSGGDSESSDNNDSESDDTDNGDSDNDNNGDAPKSRRSR